MDNEARPLRAFGSAARLFAMANAAIVFAAGCDKTADGRVSECAAFCEKAEICDDRTDLSGCRDACVAQTFRSEGYLATRAQCAADLSCNHWIGEITSNGADDCRGECALAACVEKRIKAEMLPDPLEKICQRTSNKLATCDSSLDVQLVLRECRAVAPSVSPEYLTASDDCIALPCTQISACLGDLADRYDADVKIYSGGFAP